MRVKQKIDHSIPESEAMHGQHSPVVELSEQYLQLLMVSRPPAESPELDPACLVDL